MRRRDFIGLFASAAAALPMAALRAQQSTLPVIGFLNGGSPEGYAANLAGFVQGLKEAGYTDGQNVKIEYRWAEGHYERLPAMLADLVHGQVTVLAATSTPAALAAKAGTTTIPIVFTTDGDPVQLGLVASLSRPGGNVTGAAQLNFQVLSKRLELLHELMPGAKVFAVLVNRTNPSAEALSKAAHATAGTLGVQLHVLHAGAATDFDEVFASMAQLRVAGLVIGSGDPFFSSQSEQLAALTVHHGVPAVFHNRQFVAAGGLASYGGNIPAGYRFAGIYTGRILKGEKPADLPVAQVTNVELFINTKTAKALGMTVPQSLLARADEVIE
jgi:putative ABC transport system substrate-binding protein